MRAKVFFSIPIIMPKGVWPFRDKVPRKQYSDPLDQTFSRFDVKTLRLAKGLFACQARDI